MMGANAQEVWDLLDHPRWERLRQVRHFQFSLQLVDRNHGRLKTVVTVLTTPPSALELLALPNRWKLHAVLQEFGFSVHDYVGSAKSLVNHARVLVRRIYDAEEFPEYKVEVRRRFAHDPLIQFVHGFRNFVQHEELPRSVIHTRFSKSEGFSARLVVDADRLLKSSHWNKQGRRYLVEAGDVVDLWKALELYHAKIKDFYRWFADRQEVLLESEITGFERTRKEALNKHWPELLKCVETSLDRLEQEGTGTLPQVLYPLLSLGDQRALRDPQDSHESWTKEALRRIRMRGEVPPALADRLLSYARETDRGSQS